MRDAPEDLRAVLATNTRVALRLRFGGARVSEIASAIGFERSGLYAVLGASVDLSIERVAYLAARLDDSAARLLRARNNVRG